MLAQSNPTRRRSWPRLIGIAVTMLLIGAICVGVGMIYVGVSRSLRAEENLHATLFVIRVVEQFVDENGRWPKSWQELERIKVPNSPVSPLNDVVYSGGQGGYAWPAATAQLQERVTIDFQVDQMAIIGQKLMDFQAIKPIGRCYEYRDYGFVSSLQKTLAKKTETHGRRERGP
jgi:hypothetical protein